MTKQINKAIVCWGSSLPFWWPSLLSNLILYWETGIPAWYSLVRSHFHNSLFLLTLFLPVLCGKARLIRLISGEVTRNSLLQSGFAVRSFMEISFQRCFFPKLCTYCQLDGLGPATLSVILSSGKDIVEGALKRTERMGWVTKAMESHWLGFKTCFYESWAFAKWNLGTCLPNCVLGVRSVSWVVVRIKWDSWYVVSGQYMSTNFSCSGLVYDRTLA